MREHIPTTISTGLVLVSLRNAIQLRRGVQIGLVPLYLPALCSILMAGLFPLFAEVSTSGVSSCRRSLASLHRSLVMYAYDQDGAYPVPVRWYDLTQTYRGHSDTAACRAGHNGEIVHYGFNGNLRNLDQDDRETLVVAHARSADRNAVIRSDSDLHPGNHWANLAAVGAKGSIKNWSSATRTYWDTGRARVVHWPNPGVYHPPVPIFAYTCSLSLLVSGLTALALVLGPSRKGASSTRKRWLHVFGGLACIILAGIVAQQVL